MRGILLYDLDLPDSEDWAGQIQDALKNTKDISSFEELQQIIKDEKIKGLSAFRIPRMLLEEETEDQESIVVSCKGNVQRILCHKIIYVESNKRTVKIVTREKNLCDLYEDGSPGSDAAGLLPENSPELSY